MYNPFMPSISPLTGATFIFGDGRGGGPTGSNLDLPIQDVIQTPEEIAAAEAAAAEAAQVAADYAAQAEADAAAQALRDAQAAETAQAAADMQTASVTDPASLVQSADVATIDPNATGTTIDPTTGQVTGTTATITDPTVTEANTVSPTESLGDITTAINNLEAVQGTVTPDSTVVAATTDPAELAQRALEASQIAEAQVVSPAAARTLESGEILSGSAVDMAAVSEALDIEAAQADPSGQATVRGQMAELMTDFEGTEPPAWAAGALRNATAQMAARGLGASSMAGQALIQAAMESALPIAMADAQTFAKFESQNLSNRQQTAMFAAEQRANFLGMQFTQEFQTRVANASAISDVANMNFTAEQQISLENARMAQTVDLANLSAVNAKMMADAAAMTQVDLTNLNNRQQSAVMNAQTFLAMDMKNMDLSQQAELFKSQNLIDSIFSDQSATNAAAQFNASSENQTNQFFANMQLQVDQYNSGVQIDREKFNATNSLIVRQANALWRQNTETINTGAQNQSNAQEAATINSLTANTLETIWQRERDIMDYAFRQSESATDRALSVFLADKQVTLEQWKTKGANKQADSQAKGYIFSKLLGGLF
tara:strand:+ start:330 stop:2138 length:1809 start_codon:yes stop_codon:yes gene_type:complete